MFFRVKRSGSYRYLQIVQSIRNGKQVRQRVISTIGRVDLLQESGQLDGLIRSGARFCQQLTVLDAHAAGETDPVAIRLRFISKATGDKAWGSTDIARIIAPT